MERIAFDKLAIGAAVVVVSVAGLACSPLPPRPIPGPGAGGTTGGGGTGAGGTAGAGGGAGSNGSTLAVSLNATPISVPTGDATRLSWEVSGATECTATEGSWSGRRPEEGGYEDVFVFEDTTFALSCIGADGGSSEVSVPVSIESGPLLVSVEVDAYPLVADDSFDVNLTVSNPSSSIAEAVSLSLQIPEHVIIEVGELSPNAQCTGSCEAGDWVRWDLDDVEPGAVATAVAAAALTPTVSTSQEIGFTAIASALGAVDSVASELTTVGDNQLALAVSHIPSSFRAGDTVVYLLEYENTGGNRLTDVEVTLALPNAVRFMSASHTYSEDDGVVTWSFAELAPGELDTLAVNVEVNPFLPPGALLRASANGVTSSDPALSRVTSVVPVVTEAAECTANAECVPGQLCIEQKCSPPILVQVSADHSPVSEGEMFGVFVTATNPTTTETVNAAEIELTLPEGVTGLSSRVSNGGVCSVSPSVCFGGASVTWMVGDLAPGDSRTVWVRPVSAASAGAALHFEAAVSSMNANTAQSGTTLEVVDSRSLDLALFEGSHPAASGEALSYALHYGNRGSSAISNARLSLIVPDGSTLVDAGGGVWSNGAVVWDLGSLLGGQGGQRTATVVVDASSGQQLRAEAVIVDVDAPTNESRAAAQTPVGESPLLAFVEVSRDPATDGELSHVSVSVSNPSATETRDDVRVDVPLPAGLDPFGDSEISGGGECYPPSSFCIGGKTLKWSLGSLGPGESEVVSFEPRATGSFDEPLLVFSADVRERASSEEAAVEQVTVLSRGALRVNESRALNLALLESANPAAPGQALEYALHFANQGNSTIAQAFLSLSVPDGSTLIDSGGGNASQGSVTWDVGPLGPGEGGVRAATVSVDAPAGQQLRAEARLFDAMNTSEASRAVAQTPVGESQLLAFVEVNPDPAVPDELTNVSVTVSNPTQQTVYDATVEARLPGGTARVAESRASYGATCSYSTWAYCDAGENIHWFLGELPPGEARVVSFEPSAHSSVESGLLQVYEVEVGGSQGGSVLASAAVLVQEAAARALNLRVVEDANPAASGEALTYTLQYANQSAATINDARLIFEAPDGTMLQGGSSGTWNLGSLQPGQAGVRETTVLVSESEGLQLRAEARIFDASDPAVESRATVQTPVAASTVEAVVSVDRNPAERDEQVYVSLHVTNPSAGTSQNQIRVEAQLPQGIAPVSSDEVSMNAMCTYATWNWCGGGETIYWDIDSLAPGESTGTLLWFDPFVHSGASDGDILLFEVHAIVGGVPRAVAGATIAVEGP